MGKKIVKYNPAFLSDKDLIDSFVVRQADLEIVMQVIRENVTESNQHMMIIGPRGIGKTTLALRAMAEVRKDEDLNEKWYPLVFAEESYSVTTAGEFWLEALFHLGEKEKGSKWNETYDELLEESNEDRLAERALGQLLDFADSQGKRILLVVENFNMLLGDQVDDDCAWKLRKALQHEKRIMLLATATTRFEEMDNPGKAMFDLFRSLCLNKLDRAECREIWNSVTGKDLPEERIRPLQILTGGNPRLMTIISSFGKDMSFNKLMNELTRLVDDHTEYFKSHLDGLAPVERKVYLGLAELWDPSLAKDVAQKTRISVSKVSSLLGRLKDRGAVVVVGEGKGKKKYQVAERMYNIYYLMRRRGAASRRIKAVVRFMVHFYGKDDLIQAVNRLAEEACGLKANLRRDHYLAYEAIFENISEISFRQRLLEETPAGFFELENIPNSIQSLVSNNRNNKMNLNEKKILGIITRALDVSQTKEGMQEAEKLCREAIKLKPSTYISWYFICVLLMKSGQNEKAESAILRALELKPEAPEGNFLLGLLLFNDTANNKRSEEIFYKVTELDSSNADAWVGLGLIHGTNKKHEEAAKAFRKAVEIKPDVYQGQENLGFALHYSLHNYIEAETAYRKAIEYFPRAYKSWLNLTILLIDKLNQPSEAMDVASKYLSVNASDSNALNEFALVLYGYGDRKLWSKSEEWVQEAIKIEPDNGLYQHTLASILCARGKISDSLEAVRKYLDDRETVKKTVDDVIDLFVELAARGHAGESLEVLSNSPSADILEPLVVGLRLFVGEDVSAATEILEVGKDVVKRIEEREAELDSDSSS